MQVSVSTQFILIGMVIVCLCLTILVVMIRYMNVIINMLKNRQPELTSNPVSVQDNSAVTSGDRQQIVAAIAAAIAEDLGTDVSHLRIHSIKRI